MKALLGLAAVLLLVACNEVKGDLKVFEDVVLKSKDSSFVLSPGSYRSEIRFKSKKKIEIEVRQGDAKEVALVLLKKEVKVPSNNGSFFIPAEENNQNLDIQGEVATQVEHGPVYREHESCSYTVYRRRCQTDRRGRRSCYNEPVTYRGFRRVEYHYDEIQRDYDISLSDEGRIVADFTAQENFRKRVETYRSDCR